MFVETMCTSSLLHTVFSQTYFVTAEKRRTADNTPIISRPSYPKRDLNPHSHHWPRDFKSDLNPHSHHWPRDFKSLVSTDSTIRASYSKNKSGKRDSNSRPRPWQGRALPTELLPHCGCKCKEFYPILQTFPVFSFIMFVFMITNFIERRDTEARSFICRSQLQSAASAMGSDYKSESVLLRQIANLA